MTTTPIPAPRTTDRARPPMPTDTCTLEGPCGVCATLTPAARAALAEGLAGGSSPAVEAYSEALKSAVRNVRSVAGTPVHDLWGRGVLAGYELALRSLVDTAPAGVPLGVLAEAVAALPVVEVA